MGKRALVENSEPQKYFEKVPISFEPEDEGKRDMGPLYPFLISGGENTERWYFVHINDITDYKFNIEPKYFADESNYTKSFPNRIKQILEKNVDAKIFCVFDWDTIHRDETKMRKHDAFVKQFESEIVSGSVVICSSMPCIEYWFLLHFYNDVTFYKSYSKVTQVNKFAHAMKHCFPKPDIPLKKLLKKEENLKDVNWVKNLCSDGKLELAINCAENNIKMAIENKDLDNQSYTYIYKIFKL